jgi:hypothetical protein
MVLSAALPALALLPGTSLVQAYSRSRVLLHSGHLMSVVHFQPIRHDSDDRWRAHTHGLFLIRDLLQ